MLARGGPRGQNSAAMKVLALDGRSLSLDDVAPVLTGADVRVELADSARPRVRAARDLVERHVANGDVVYGLTTGFGKLKNVAIPAGDLEALQRNLVLSHCTAVGRPLSKGEVRAAQVFRLNGLVRGHSGVRWELLEHLVRLFNAGFVPVVPEQGSCGASGDLAPLAQMAAAYMGFGDAWVEDDQLAARDALQRVGEEPLVLQAKEGLALINGTEIMKAVGVGAWHRAVNLAKAADIAAALTLEGLCGSVKPMDDRLADLKGHAGHRRTAANLRALLAGSEILTSHVDCDRVQDPYSLRCVPQIHGAVKTAVEHVGEVLACELNAVTDNPVLFPDTGETISAGQFHGQPISIPMDYLALSLCTLANVSERRVEQLVNPDLSLLPPFLARDPGLHSGFMIAQVTAASLASENKSLAHPASVDSIPTSANQEDHVSMGVTAARKARAICENLEAILGIELLVAAQAQEFHAELQPGAGARAAYECVRALIPAHDGDRYLQPDLRVARELVASGRLVAAVERAVGPLSV